MLGAIKAAQAAASLFPIQFIDLVSQQRLIRKELEERWIRILDHGAYINGPEVTELEDVLKNFTGAADVIAVGSGTQALSIPMAALGIGPGDAVFIPAFTYNATANAVIRAGAHPVFVDVKADTFNIDPEHLAARIEYFKNHPRLTPKAIVAVDLFGLPADYDAIFELAKAHNLFVIGDGAQSFGGKLHDRWVGNIAPITGTSFFPAKALGCYGDGGAVFIQDADFGEAMRSIRWHGTDNGRRDSVRVGINGRLDSIQCAVVTEKMKLFPAEVERRIEIARVYEREFKGLPIGMHAPQPGAVSGYGYFTITVKKRDEVRARLQELQVPSAIYYGKVLHQMDAFKEFGPEAGLPVCERLADEVVSIPVHPYLSDAQLDYIVQSVKRVVTDLKL